MTDLEDKDFASSSDDEGSHTHSNQGVDGTSPASSAEEDQDERAADGG